MAKERESEAQAQRAADVSAQRLADQMYRIAYRLLGDSEQATVMAERAEGRLAFDDDHDGDAALLHSTASLLELVHRRTDHGFRPDDEHSSQRARILRDLHRYQTDDRVVLALRHLLGLAPARVAAITQRTETEVRAVTSRWAPQDAVHTGTMLTSLDTWIDLGLRERQIEAAVPTLDHLDDPQRTDLISSSGT